MGVRLRPVEPADQAFLARLHEPDVAGPLAWFDDPPEERAGPPASDRGHLIVALEDGTPIGDVGWIAVFYGPNVRSVAWKIGITILPGFRGQGFGSLAQRMLADHLFATTPCNRVEADTDVENIAEQRALERAGFRREGVLRGAQHRQGRWHDLVLYARLRDDDRAP